MMASTVEFKMEVEVKSPADALWKTVKELSILYPKLFPDIYESIEILEGDGRTTGSIRMINYSKESSMGKGYKTRIESVDEENKTVVYRVIEGDLLKYYKSFGDTITVRAKEDKGSIIVWSCIYEKAIKEALDGDTMRDTMIGIFQKIDAYTLAVNT